MPLHVGKKRTVSTAISEIIDYVKNDAKTDQGRLITSYECDSRMADAEFFSSFSCSCKSISFDLYIQLVIVSS